MEILPSLNLYSDNVMSTLTFVIGIINSFVAILEFNAKRIVDVYIILELLIEFYACSLRRIEFVKIF